MRRITLAALILLATSTLTAQSPAPPRFEVASVKPDPKQDRGGARSFTEFSMPIVRVLPSGQVESYGHTLRNLIAWASEINTVPQRAEGKQEQLEMEFNISAKAAAPSLTPAEAKAMFRTLLEERFQLRWRLQPRDVDGYAMMPSRDDRRPGSGLRAFSGDCAARANNRGVRFDSPDYEQQRPCGGWSGINDRYRGVGLSMEKLSETLTFIMQAPVSDRTGWPGLFTFDIRADIGDMPISELQRSTMGGTRPLIDAPPLLDVFRSELGLKLVKERATINDLVVERVEPLIEN